MGFKTIILLFLAFFATTSLRSHANETTVGEHQASNEDCIDTTADERKAFEEAGKPKAPKVESGKAGAAK